MIRNWTVVDASDSGSDLDSRAACHALVMTYFQDNDPFRSEECQL